MEPYKQGKQQKTFLAEKTVTEMLFLRCTSIIDPLINFDWYGNIEKSMKAIFHALGRAKIFTEADVLLPDTAHTIPCVSVQYHMLQ